MSPMAGDAAAIILAAGEGTRLNKDKLFEQVEGVPIVQRALQPFLQAQRVGDVVLVVPADRQDDFSWLRGLRVHLIANPAPEQGMISSIRLALDTAWAKGRDFLICPADMPYVKVDVIEHVIRAYLTRGCKIVIPAYKGLGGHPSLFAAELQEDFFLHGDKNGVREILARHARETARLSLPDPDVCFDVDTPEDLRIAADPGARWARVETQAENKRLGR